MPNKKYWKTWVAIFLGLILVILQMGLIGFLSAPYNFLNFGILAMILWFFYKEQGLALVFLLTFGLFLDIFHFELFGIYTLSLVATAILSSLILRNLLTNRSAYSFVALTAIATIIYNIIFCLLFYLTHIMETYYFPFWSWNFWWGLFWETGLHAVIIFVFFLIMNLTTNRLKPVFLEKN